MPDTEPSVVLDETTGFVSVSWTLALGATAAPKMLPKMFNPSVQVKGTFGGASVALHGTLDDSASGSFAALTDTAGVALSFTAAAYALIAQAARYFKPVLSGGDGTTAITITIGGYR